jgi:dTDP-4-dehydrorhamnose 3,5-epimerase
VQIRELSIPDAFEVTPVVRSDYRGAFLESYRHDLLEEAASRSLNLRQANTSVSRRGVLRGIHFADIPLGQAKYVTVTHGAILDFVVDLRVGSPTFGQWDSVQLDGTEFHALFVAEGLGHAFLALTEDTTVSYLVSDVYRPDREHGVNPLDPEIGLEFPFARDELIISAKDLEAPTLAEARDSGLLPAIDVVRDFYASLSQGGR